MAMITIERLTRQDRNALFEFETVNRAFFETMVPGRGDDYYRFDHFLTLLEQLLDEQEEGLSYFHLIKDEAGAILGRMNIVDIDPAEKMAELGYRIGRAYTGKGIASQALQLVQQTLVHQYGLNGLRAKTTRENVASQKVLLKNSFKQTGQDEQFLHYVWTR